MALEGYPGIEPLGGFKDKGRDAIHRCQNDRGKVTIFAYSVREDWQKKLNEDAAKVRANGHHCDRLVFLSTAHFTSTERDKAIDKIAQEFGWEVELYGLERLRVLLAATRPHVVAQHPQIFTPSLFSGGLDRVEAKVDVVRVEQAAGLGRVIELGSEVDAKVEGIAATVERMAAMTGESLSELMEACCELSNRGEHERALEVARKAARISRRMNDDSLERECLVHQGSILFAAAANETSSFVVDQLRQVLRECGRLGLDTWQFAVVKLQLSRVLRDHQETIATSRLILAQENVPIRQKVDALMAMIIALARLDRTPELLLTAADIENLADRIDLDDQVPLRANWLLAAADVGLFERSAVTKFLDCLTTAASTSGDLAIAKAADLVFMAGDALRKTARRDPRGDWLEAAHEVFSTGYRLVEPTRDAHRLLTFSIQLAEIALDLGNSAEAETWLERGEDALAANAKFETPQARLSHRCLYLFTKARIVMRISERSDRTRKEPLLRASLAAFEETEALLEKSAGALRGEIDLMPAEIAQRKAIIYDRLGEYPTALGEVRKAVSVIRAMRDADWAADVRLHEAELTARVGDVVTARSIVDDLLARSDLSQERHERVRGFDAYLSKRLVPTLEWLGSDQAKQVSQQTRKEDLHRAIAAVHRPLVNWWKAWRSDHEPWPASELFDFWGRGAFMRIVAAVRARPTHAIAVDATSIDEIRHWVRVFCPLFDTVIIKWKGEIGSGIVIVPRHISQGGEGDFGGHGYVPTADFVREEWNVAMGWANLVPQELSKFLASEALGLVERGRLVVIPARLVGASQLATGWTDDLLTAGLFRGVVNAARTSRSPTEEKPMSGRVVDVTSGAIPYMRGVALPALADMLEELAEPVAALRKLWNSEIAYVANDEWQKINTLEDDFSDACRTLRERMARLTRSDDRTAIGELSAGTSALSGQSTQGGAAPVTEFLHDLATDRALTPWIPFWRLSEQGGQLDWNAATDQLGQPIPQQVFERLQVMGFRDFGPAVHSWLCPGDAGCGVAMSIRVDNG